MSAVEASSVRILFFGMLRDVHGPSLTLATNEPTSVSSIWTEVTRSPLEVAEKGGVRAARNLEFCSWEQIVEPGDEVAFLPPVSGG